MAKARPCRQRAKSRRVRPQVFWVLVYEKGLADGPRGEALNSTRCPPPDGRTMRVKRSDPQVCVALADLQVSVVLVDDIGPPAHLQVTWALIDLQVGFVVVDGKRRQQAYSLLVDLQAVGALVDGPGGPTCIYN